MPSEPTPGLLRPRRAAGGLLLHLLLTLGACAGSAAAPDGETVGWLAGYIQLDTSNPPGNEHLAADYLRRILHAEGIETRLFVAPGGRTSLYARLAADPGETGDRGALILHHHMDVVPAGPGWSIDPFSGEIVNGFVLGRGAVDDKSLGIAHLAALIDLKRSGARRARDVIFLAVAAEESGGADGTEWLLENHPQLFAPAAAVLGEGGANRAVGQRIGWWGVEVAQKRPLWIEVSATGRGGHGSTLNLHTAPHRLVRALARLVDRPLEFRLTPEARRYLEAVAPLQSQVFQELVANLDEIVAAPQPETRLLPGLPTFLLDSIQVDVLRAGDRVNVAPETASALVDIRLLPDTDDEALLADLERLLGADARLKVLLSSPQVAPSPADGEIYRRLEEVLGEEAPVIPAFIPGVTDSRYFRLRGIPAYGFSPFALDSQELRGIHGPNEKIPVAAFERGVGVMKRVVRACATR